MSHHCLCDFLSTVWLSVLQRTHPPRTASLDSVLENISSRQVQLELQDRRCVSEARRHHACGSKALFRAKMLEHRRFQAQLLQLQRYRENVNAQMDAMSHHQINQTFARAIAQGPLSREEAETVVEDLQESMSKAKEITDLLGQPLDSSMYSEDIMDEDLEQEFMETVERTAETAPLLPVVDRKDSVVKTPVAATVRPEQFNIRLPAAMLS
jgi:hypothetical protein